MPITVLMLVNRLEIGGTETHVLSLAKQLRRAGVDVIIGTAGGAMLDAFLDSGLEVVLLPFQTDNPVYAEYKALLEKTKELVQARSVNLIHAHSLAALKVAVQVADETLIPVVATIHGKFYTPRRLRGLLDRCPKVIAVSMPVVTWLSKAVDYPLSQIALIPNGVDTEYFLPGSTHNEFRSRLEIPAGEKLIVLVSRLAWEKTRVVETAIQAVAKLQSEFPVHLAVAGTGAHQPLVKAAAQIANDSAGREIIHIVGPVLDPLPYYQAADIVIGTARVALEALSCQKPLIAGGNVSYVGYLHPGNLEKAWSVYFGDHHWAYPLTVERLLNDLRYVFQHPEEAETNAQQLREWVAANFDISIVTEETIRFYEDTLADRELSASLVPEPHFLEDQPADRQQRSRKKDQPSLSSFSERPLISVAIPAYNRAHYLRDCLDSVAAQTYRPLEIVVVNDGSADRTDEVVRQWWQSLTDRQGLSFRYLELPHNTGYASAQTIAYALTTGEFIANQDSDDISHPERLEKQLAFLLANPDYSLVGTNFAVFTDDVTKRRRSYMIRSGFEKILSSYQNGDHVICFGTLLFRRAVFARIGGLTSFLKGAEDYEWITRALNQGFYAENLREQLYYYRSHPGQLSRLVKGTRQRLRPWEYELEGVPAKDTG